MQTLNPPQFDTYLTCDNPGDAAVLQAPNGKGWAIIYTDYLNAAGVAQAKGQDDAWAAALAQYWREQARAGAQPGLVFERLAHQHGVEFACYERLRDLSHRLCALER